MVVVVIAWYAATACRDEAGNGNCDNSGRSGRTTIGDAISRGMGAFRILDKSFLSSFARVVSSSLSELADCSSALSLFDSSSSGSSPSY